MYDKIQVVNPKEKFSISATVARKLARLFKTPMTKNEFATLFRDALEIAAENAEFKFGVSVSREFQIKLFGAGHPGDLLPVNKALDSLYLGPNRFYRIIDLAVIKALPHATYVFVRASDHEPTQFEKTWNEPAGMGPFKQIIPEKIECEP